MNQQMKIIKEIAQVADKDDFHDQAKKFGEIASGAFGSRHRNQMTNLENVANSTLKVTDVLDYIKKQVARANKNETWRENNFGELVKEYVEQNLRTERDEICGRLEGIEETSLDGQRIYLDLIREFVRQLVVHYEYRVTIGGEHDGIDNRSGTEDSSVE